MPNLELSLSALATESLLSIEHQGSKLLLVRSKDDRVFAYHDRCPHAFWPLSEGTLRGAVVECPGHGWEFDLASGRCLTAPVYCLSPVGVSVDADSVRLVWPDDAPAAAAAEIGACPASARPQTRLAVQSGGQA